ncbi:hypothetical protein [Moraxella lacunata]|uniref:hypothetical protein n=1 Tax=Moraxella lacunata TaxID=477 RepID=UPI003EE0FF65
MFIILVMVCMLILAHLPKRFVAHSKSIRLPAKLQLKKTVRGELCLPITVFRYPSTSSGRTEN